jgi:hypothetical protein
VTQLPVRTQANHAANAVNGDDIEGVVVAQPVFQPDRQLAPQSALAHPPEHLDASPAPRAKPGPSGARGRDPAPRSPSTSVRLQPVEHLPAPGDGCGVIRLVFPVALDTDQERRERWKLAACARAVTTPDGWRAQDVLVAPGSRCTSPRPCSATSASTPPAAAPCSPSTSSPRTKPSSNATASCGRDGGLRSGTSEGWAEFEQHFLLPHRRLNDVPARLRELHLRDYGIQEPRLARVRKAARRTRL